jgi:thiosulfate dehydrogenase [quinone] large subunit
VTFLYAGIQKLLDPNFLHPGSTDFVKRQLEGFAQGSPIAGVLHALAHVPLLAGVGIALAEIAIGIGTLLGIAPILFALGGFVVNLSLTLSATWHVHPYFLGSDSIYAVAWLAYAAGLLDLRRRAARATAKRSVLEPDAFGRREFLRVGVLAGLTLIAAGAAKAFSGSPTSSALASGARSGRVAQGGSSDGAAQGPPGAPQAAGGAAPPSPPSEPTGTTIANLDRLSVGEAIGFDAPGVGPAVLVRTGQSRVEAYSRTCTHAGCLVGYDPNRQILVCPCHGAEFDLARGAEVVGGPAPTALPPVDVTLDRATGDVVLPK